jgi:hypothetical protein
MSLAVTTVISGAEVLALDCVDVVERLVVEVAELSVRWERFALLALLALPFGDVRLVWLRVRASAVPAAIMTTKAIATTTPLPRFAISAGCIPILPA